MESFIVLLCLGIFSNGFVSAIDKMTCDFNQDIPDHVKETCYQIHDSTIKPDDETAAMADTCMMNKNLESQKLETVWKGGFEESSIFMIPRKKFRLIEILFFSNKQHQFDSLRIHHSSYTHVEDKGKFYRAFPFERNGIYLLRLNSSTGTLSIQRIINSTDSSATIFTVSSHRRQQLSVACHKTLANVEDNISPEMKIRAEGPSSWLAFNNKKCDEVFMAGMNPSLVCDYKTEMLKSFSESEANKTMEFEAIDTLGDKVMNVTRSDTENNKQSAQRGESSLLLFIIIVCVIFLVLLTMCCMRNIVKKCSDKEYGVQPNTYEAESSLHITESHFHPNGGCENETVDTEETVLDKVTPPISKEHDCKPKVTAKLSTIEEQTPEKDSLKLSVDQHSFGDMDSLDEISLKTKSPRNSSTNNLLSDDQLSNDFDCEIVQRQDVEIETSMT